MGPEQTPGQPSVSTPDVGDRIKAMLANTPLPVGSSIVSPHDSARLSQLSAAQVQRPPIAAAPRVIHPNAAPSAVKPATNSESTTNGINIKIVNGDKDKPDAKKRFSRIQEAAAFILVAAAVAGGGILWVKKNGLPWQHDDSKQQAISAPLKPGAISNSASSGAAKVAPLTKTSPTGVPKSCAPTGGTLPVFQPQAIKNLPLVNGRINNLVIPIENSYIKPGDPKKQVFKLDGVFKIQVSGAFAISGSADPTTEALTYSAANSTASGNSSAVFDASKMTTKLDQSHEVIQLQVPKHSVDRAMMGTELAQVFSQHFSPALTVTPAQALAIYDNIYGNPNGTTSAEKAGQRPALMQAAQSAIVGAIQSSQLSELASAYKQTIVPVIEQQQMDQCIPKANIGDTFQFDKIPNMAAQYPAPAANSTYSLQLNKAVINPGAAASGKTLAVPATFVVKPAGGQ